MLNDAGLKINTSKTPNVVVLDVDDSNFSESKDALYKQTKFTIFLVSGIGLSLVLLYFIWFAVLEQNPLADSPAPWGAFGDFVGGLMNPLVAFTALYWLTRSVKIQKEELSETKQELAESREAQQHQAETLEKQRFENTFFALLTQHNNVLESLNAPVMRYNGMSVVQKFHVTATQHSLAEAKSYLEENDYQYGHYFRILYQLLKLVATRCPGTKISMKLTTNELLKSKVESDEKFYTNIIRAFLNVDLSQMLAINCYCESGGSYWKYKCLVERYAFLEHMPFERNHGPYLAMVEAAGFYRRRAFGDSDYLRELNLGAHVK